MEDVMYIYALCDPRTHDQRYIGSTGNPSRRVREHNQFPALPIQAWIDELHSLGLEAMIEVIEETTTQHRQQRERAVIEHYRKSLGPLLLNRDLPRDPTQLLRTKLVGVYLDESDYLWLKDIAKHSGQSMTRHIEQLIQQARSLDQAFQTAPATAPAPRED